MSLVKNDYDNKYISHYVLDTLRRIDYNNNINLNIPDKIANKLYVLLDNFKNRYENDVDYKKDFDERLSNVNVELIYKTKIDDIFEVFYEMGFTRINLIEYSSNILKFDVVVNLDVFDTNKYGYIGGSNPNIIENDKLILQKIIMENLKKFEIINDNNDNNINNMHIDIDTISESRYL